MEKTRARTNTSTTSRSIILVYEKYLVTSTWYSLNWADYSSRWIVQIRKPFKRNMLWSPVSYPAGSLVACTPEREKLNKTLIESGENQKQ
jgi:hypothetical protein